MPDWLASGKLHPIGLSNVEMSVLDRRPAADDGKTVLQIATQMYGI